MVSKIFAATNSPRPTIQGLAPPFSMQIFTTGALERWMDPAAAPISAISAAAAAISRLTSNLPAEVLGQVSSGERGVYASAGRPGGVKLREGGGLVEADYLTGNAPRRPSVRLFWP